MPHEVSKVIRGFVRAFFYDGSWKTLSDIDEATLIYLYRRSNEWIGVDELQRALHKTRKTVDATLNFLEEIGKNEFSQLLSVEERVGFIKPLKLGSGDLERLNEEGIKKYYSGQKKYVKITPIGIKWTERWIAGIDEVNEFITQLKKQLREEKKESEAKEKDALEKIIKKTIR